ncbi:hypothetical protein DIU36_18235 [Mucilaginibacter rubeus]|nr:hypothetical protein DIU36_18235 [Mucilaginibacter rubeus]
MSVKGVHKALFWQGTTRLARNDAWSAVVVAGNPAPNLTMFNAVKGDAQTADQKPNDRSP